MVHNQDKNSDKNEYTARNSQHVIVRNLSEFTLCSRFLKIQTDGDFTASLDRLFQASMTLLLKVLPDISKRELFESLR